MKFQNRTSDLPNQSINSGAFFVRVWCRTWFHEVELGVSEDTVCIIQNPCEALASIPEFLMIEPDSACELCVDRLDRALQSISLELNETAAQFTVTEIQRWIEHQLQASLADEDINRMLFGFQALPLSLDQLIGYYRILCNASEKLDRVVVHLFDRIANELAASTTTLTEWQANALLEVHNRNLIVLTLRAILRSPVCVDPAKLFTTRWAHRREIKRLIQQVAQLVPEALKTRAAYEAVEQLRSHRRGRCSKQVIDSFSYFPSESAQALADHISTFVKPFAIENALRFAWNSLPSDIRIQLFQHLSHSPDPRVSPHPRSYLQMSDSQ